MTQDTHTRHVGDTITVLECYLEAKNATGVLTAKSLAGLDVPQFKMINTVDGVTKVSLSATGVTVVDASGGLVRKDFAAADVDTAGIYRGFFVVTDSEETDHYPAIKNDLLIKIDSDTQTAQEAYDAAENP